MPVLSRLANFVARQIGTPAAPPAGSNVLYPKVDGAWYTLGPDGVERRVGGGGVLRPDVQIFSTVGSATWFKPPGAKYVEVEVIGGGGGGGGAGTAAAGANSAGSGGGAGGYAWSNFDASSLPAAVPVVVGAGGAGVANTNGGTGDPSSFGYTGDATYVAANGGIGGIVRASNTIDHWQEGGTGGLATAGQIRVDGEAGGASNGDATYGKGGQGGNTKYGQGGKARGTGGSNTPLAGYAATGYGAGGGGALCTGTTAVTRNGGNGAPGIVIVTTYFDTDGSNVEKSESWGVENLIANPSFETLNPDGTPSGWNTFWAINSPTHSIETNLLNVFEGAKAAKVVLDQDDMGRYGSQTIFACSAGEIITVRCRVKTDSTAGVEGAILFMTSGPSDPTPDFFSSGSTQQSASWVSYAADGYALKEYTFVVPQGHSKGHIYVQLHNPAARAGGTITVWLDKVQVLSEMNPTGAAAIIRDPPGVVKEYAGFTPPTGYLLCNGTAYSRTLYSALWDAITYKFTASGTSGTSTITSSDIGPAVMGMEVTGPGVPAGTTITGIVQTTGYSVGLSNPLTATSSNAEFRLAPHGAGDGTTTFNVPDRRGRFGVGVDGSAEFNFLGKKAGSKTHVHQLASHAHGLGGHVHGTATFSGNTAGISYPTGVGYAGGANQGTSRGAFDGHSHGMSHSHGNTGGPSGGSDGSGTLTTGGPDNQPPNIGMNYIIKT